MEKSFAADQIEKHRGALGGRLKLFDKVTREQSWRHIREANVTLCYSIRECLPMFVFEGMLAGHPILRNECSGIDEQLVDGENGYLAGAEDYWGLVAAIEKILNRDKTPNEMLASMSRRSYEMAHAQRHNRCAGLVEQIRLAYAGESRKPTDSGYHPHIRIDAASPHPGKSLPAGRASS
ncbi:MAG: glycosyltransferase [Isosphaeraceae bacterium]